jgi:dienelactone hydrolase
MTPLQSLAYLVNLSVASPSTGLPQETIVPDSVVIRSGTLQLHGLLWRPIGNGPFPAILINHGSYRTGEPLGPYDPGVLGSLFANHGYACLVLFRRGVGPSVGAGPPDGELLAQALASQGQTARNRVQLELLEGEALHEATAGVAYLRGLSYVDQSRVGLLGHSFGGSLSIILAAHDSTIAAVVLFGAAAASWASSPELQHRLLTAVGRTKAPIFFIHAANDYSVAPGKALANELHRLGRPHRLKIYPPFGSTSREGHNLVFRSPDTWKKDVFAFLDARLVR